MLFAGVCVPCLAFALASAQSEKQTSGTFYPLKTEVICKTYWGDLLYLPYIHSTGWAYDCHTSSHFSWAIKANELIPLGTHPPFQKAPWKWRQRHPTSRHDVRLKSHVHQSNPRGKDNGPPSHAPGKWCDRGKKLVASHQNPCLIEIKNTCVFPYLEKNLYKQQTFGYIYFLGLTKLKRFFETSNCWSKMLLGFRSSFQFTPGFRSQKNTATSQVWKKKTAIPVCNKTIHGRHGRHVFSLIGFVIKTSLFWLQQSGGKKLQQIHHPCNINWQAGKPNFQDGLSQDMCRNGVDSSFAPWFWLLHSPNAQGGLSKVACFTVGKEILQSVTTLKTKTMLPTENLEECT